MRSRRSVLRTAGAALLGAASTSFAETWRRTPTQVLGPFYPIHKLLDADADLTRVRGREARANIVPENG